MGSRLRTIASHLCTSYVSDALDFMRLKDLFPQEINEKRIKLRERLEREVKPRLAELYDKGEFPYDLLPALKDMDITGLDRAAYGCRQLTSIEKAAFLYEIGRLDTSLATFYLINTYLVCPTIEKLGSEAQKSAYLPKLVSFESIGCWGLTEANYGSDASGLETAAQPVSGGFRLNGSKKWVGNAHSQIFC